MKIKLLSILFGAAALILPTACTTSQAVAVGEYEGGDAFATYELGKVDPSPAGTAAQAQAVATLKRVAADLVSFAQGSLTQTELGAITETLQQQKLQIINNQKATDQVNNLLNVLQTQVVASPTGAVTPIVALETGAVQNLQKGILASIAYFEGKWSVSNPGAAPTSMLTPETSGFLPLQVVASR